MQVVVALGKIAFDAWLQLLKRRGASIDRRGRSSHTAVVARVDTDPTECRNRARVLSPEPAEHEHRKADAGDDGGRVQEGERILND